MTPKQEVSEMLINMGVQQNLQGYQYLRHAILISLENPAIIHNVMKQLYPMVAKEYGTTDKKVERAIRHAIEVLFEKGSGELIDALFSRIKYKVKPCNSLFIAVCVDYIELEWESREYFEWLRMQKNEKEKDIASKPDLINNSSPPAKKCLKKNEQNPPLD